MSRPIQYRLTSQMTFRDQMIKECDKVITDNYKIWRSCLHKRRYSLQSDADAVAARYGKGYSYWCVNEGCNGFHVTTQDR